MSTLKCVGSQMEIAWRRLLYTRLLIGFPSTALDRRWIQCIQNRFRTACVGFELLFSVKMPAEKGRRPH